MSKSRRRKRLLDSGRGNSNAAGGNNTNPSELNCNVIATRRGGPEEPSGRPPGHLKHPPQIGWQQSLLLVGLLLAWQQQQHQSGAHVVSEDEDSVIISVGQQGHLFRGRKLASLDDELGGQPKQVAAFLGLRYASAPIKRLRFMPPTPFSYGPTKQVAAQGEQRPAHDMRHFGPICMQRLPMEPARDQIWPPQATNEEENWRPRRWQLQSALMDRLLVPQVSSAWRPLVRQLTSGRFVQSEDCLNLNIYTPIEALRHSQQTNATAAKANLPVLVLIHGHSFDFGSGSTLDGRQFARNRRGLVITLNYRLHILATSIAGLTGKAGASSRTNLGLLDQVAALHWIQANVRSFGGSPNRITLMGAKGGAQFVHLLMVSPLARGLFQRAVLEDGTALSPIVANSVPVGQTRQLVGGPHQLQQQSQLAAAKLVAQLNDCPLGPTEDEHPTWTPIVECLKTRQAAALVRNLPLELIDTGRPASASSIPIAAKWLPSIEQALDLLIKEELKARLDQEDRHNKSSGSEHENQPNSRREQMEELKQVLVRASSAEQSSGVSLESQQLNKLIGLMIHRFLQEPADPTEPVMVRSSDESHRLRSLLAEILGAIYLPSNKTFPVGPLFAPQLDSGLILSADHQSSLASTGVELASSMLHPNSPFAQRDLLIGLTHSLIANTSETRPSVSSNYVAPSLSSRRQLETGLTEEQAISKVNLFVNSFYRYHQQEISNSIVSQYLSRKSNTLPSGAATQASNQQNYSSQQLQKQLFLAEAMRELYQDSLVDIPLIRTALIHSMRQLDTLAELFVSQQVVKLSEAQKSENRDHEELEQLISERKLDEEFHDYVRGLYRDPNRWPIRLVPIPSSVPIRADQLETNHEKQSHSTFLFQLGANFEWLKPKLEIAIQHNHSNPQTRTILVKLLKEFAERTDHFEACSFEDLFRVENFEDGELDSSPQESLLSRFRLWICGRRLEERLANFVETGNVNRGSKFLQEPKSIATAFEHECANSLQDRRQREDNLNDHHLVQLMANPTKRGDFEILVEKGARKGELRCERLLEQMAFEELFNDDGNNEDNNQQDWSVFNVFNQQLASLFSADNNDANWSQDSFLNLASNQLERERFDSKVTFWANFVSALNCSRTQPIGAGSLTLFAQANSTLLNMNLNLNCQQQSGGATQQTANYLIQMIVGRIKQELSQQVVTWRRHRGQARGQPTVANLSSSQNHHSLRMANMSNGQQEQHHQQQQQQQQGRMVQFEEGAAELATDGASSGLDLFAGWLAADNKWPNGPQKHSLQIRLALTSGAVLVVVLVLTISVLVVNRQWKRRQSSAKNEVSSNGLETAQWSEPSESNLQLDAGRLDEEHSVKLDSPNEGQNEASDLRGVELLFDQQQPYDNNHLHEAAMEQNPNHLELFVSPASFVQGQHTHLVHFANQENGFSDTQVNVANGLLHHNHHHNHHRNNHHQQQQQQHLPTCNLILMGQNQQHLLSSSSETNSTTNNTSQQRAPSSVSLVSSITPTNEGQPKRAQKKRVQISDPKRRDETLGSSRGSHQHLAAGGELAGSRFQFAELSSEGSGGDQLTCPVHRSSSNLSLMLQASGANIPNGTSSLMRLHDFGNHNNHNNHRHQQRALALHDQSQQQVCAVHSFYQQPESNSGDLYAGHERLH